jgi:hypothetical protein
MVQTKPPSDNPEKRNVHSSHGDDRKVAQVEDFFQHKPNSFKAAKDHTSSTNTRPPASFDRHLDLRLRLRRVVYLPSMTRDLKQIAKTALQSASSAGVLPSISDAFPLRTMRQKWNRQAPYHHIICEDEIQNIYETTTAKFCSVVASTLEFQLPRWSRGHLDWTKKTRKVRGIADGYLRLNERAVDTDIPPCQTTSNMLSKTSLQ